MAIPFETVAVTAYRVIYSIGKRKDLRGGSYEHLGLSVEFFARLFTAIGLLLMILYGCAGISL